MRITTKIFILFFVVLLIVPGEEILAAVSITVTGSWSLSIDASNLQDGAGSKLTAVYKSPTGGVTIEVSGTTGNWQVDVEKIDSNWHSDFVLKVKRTSDGRGPGSISGGDTWTSVLDSYSAFFTGSGDRKKIKLKYKLSGVSLSQVPDTYTTTIYYQVTDQSSSHSDNHPITITIAAINELTISGGDVPLTVDSATAGSNPDNAVDETTSDLLWSTNEIGKKITVASDLASPVFVLKARAKNVKGGTRVGTVTLGTTAQDFVTEVAGTKGSCDLKYIAVARATKGTGTEAHTVTYLLVNQE